MTCNDFKKTGVQFFYFIKKIMDLFNEGILQKK